MSKHSSTEVILQGQSNWELWFFVVKRIAEAGDVWEYINPDQPPHHLQKPEKPTRPVPTINDDGTTIEPTDRALAQYNQDNTAYYSEVKEYRRLRDKVGQVEAYITKTIQQDLLYHIKDKATIHDQLKALQGLFSPTTADKEYQVQKDYSAAKILHARRSNIEDWCNEFLIAYNRAKQLDLPEVYGFRPHKDLVRAIKQIDAAYAATVSLEIFKAEETWNSDRSIPITHQFLLPTILADFLRYYRTTYSRKANIHGGVFGAATLNGQQSQYSRKRSRDDGTPTKPCLCGDNHFWGQCPYIDKALRSRGFVEDPEKAKKITDFEARDPQGILNKIREKNRRFKKHKARDTSNKQHMSASDSIEIDAGDPVINQSPHEAYAVFSSAFNNQIASQSFPLLHSWTLDPATDIHICNNPAEFQWKAPAADDDLVLAGGTETRIEAWGEVKIPLSTPSGIKTTTLKQVALIPSFFTSLVSLSRLYSSNIHFDSGRNILYRRTRDVQEPIASLTKLGGHWLVVHRTQPPPPIQPTQPAAFATNQRRPQISALPLKPRVLTKPQLHVLLGHAGSDAIDHLASNVQGIQLSQSIITTPTTIECEECAQNKAHQIISRRIGHEIGASRPFETVAIDLIKLDTIGYNGHRHVFHGFDLCTKLNLVYTIPKRDKATLLEVLTRLDRAIKREFNTTVTFLIADDERGYGLTDDSARAYCAQEGIRLQIRAPYVEEQNGAAERSGKSLIERARCLMVTANLPLALAPEAYITAAYLLNRTPTRSIQWKTPFEIAYHKKPSIAHLKLFGCRAYALRTQIPRGDKLTPRALIGYLVGYDASNIYRIWLPKARSKAHQGKVIRTRDVTFKEDLFYKPDNDSDPLLPREQLTNIIRTIHMPPLQDLEDSSEEEYEQEGETSIAPSNQATQPAESNSKPHEPHGTTSGPLPTPSPTASPTALPTATPDDRSTTLGRSPTPDFQPSTQASRKRKRRDDEDTNAAQNRELIDSNLRQSHILPEGSKRARKPSYKSSSFFVRKYWSTFVAASITAPKTRFHHSSLPPEPRFYQDVMKLPAVHKQGFIAAMQRELSDVKRKDTYRTIAWKDFNAQDNEVLPIIWVFKYKPDDEGYLRKYKARVCVRGDLQATAEDTYAATLAARVFRALMAIAAYFNLEIRQYDAVNAFINAPLETPVYCYPPEGFADSDHLWELRRALYGLKTSPLLWYKEITKTLKELGLHEVKEAPCLWKSDKLIVFFYVDDIVILARPAHMATLDDFERRLLRRYEIRPLGDLSTFCGIQTHRDRSTGSIWLSQQAYIDKLATKYPAPKPLTRPPATPLPLEELLPSDQPSNDANIHRYAQLVGSIGYVATATRPDVSKAHSKLAEFLTNPSQQHINAAYQALEYLYSTKDRALHYDASISTDTAHIEDYEEPDFFGATDASYADHKATRKSSQGYIFFLFGGPIDWKATLQRCVTKSTTEAELVAASSAGTELLWWWRLFKDIEFDPDNKQILYCDNQQTIRLVTAASPRLKTSLRHVDIHHHWLRQEAQSNNVNLTYMPTSIQPADGLTKLLPRQRHENWVKLLHFNTFPTTSSTQ